MRKIKYSKALEHFFVNFVNFCRNYAFPEKIC